MTNKILILNTIMKEKIWGTKIRDKYIGEVIKFSINSNESNWVENYNSSLYNIYKNEKLRKTVFGRKYLKKEMFPYIVKYIYAGSNLSLQVHPKEKEEVWYFINPSKIIVGFKKKYNSNSNFNVNNLLQSINYYVPMKEQLISIKANTIHSILGGNIVCEIKSNLADTYRLYDWNRRRKLNVSDAIKNLNFDKISPKDFIINKNLYKMKNIKIRKMEFHKKKHGISLASCCCLIVVSGEGKILVDNETISLFTGQCILITPYTKYQLLGNMKIIKII